MRDWIGGIAAWLSQGINCALLSGSPDMTVSARCYVNRHKPRWRTAYRIINRLFFLQDNHCLISFLSDVKYAQRVMEIVNGDNISSDSQTIGRGNAS